MTRMAKSSRAFTLLEMSIVLAIIAVVVGGGMTIFSASLQKRQLQETQFKMKAIQKALYDFRIYNNRLPCPADVTLPIPTDSVTPTYFGFEAGSLVNASWVPDAGFCTTYATSYSNDVLQGTSANSVASNFRNVITYTGNTFYVATTGNTYEYFTVDTIKSGTTNIGVGMSVSGLTIPAGDTVAALNPPSSVTLNTASTAPANGISLTFTTPVVTNMSSISGIVGVANGMPGMAVSGIGIPIGDYTVNASGSVVVLSKPPIAAYTGVSLTFLDLVQGMVPTNALHLPDDYAIDGWGRRIMYTVDARLTGNNALSSSVIPATDNGMRIVVNDGDTSQNPRHAKTKAAAYALVSFGANGHGAYPRDGGTARINTGSNNPDEQANCDCNNAAVSNNPIPGGIFYQEQPNYYPPPTNRGDPSYYFDDIVTYGTRSDLRSPTE